MKHILILEDNPSCIFVYQQILKASYQLTFLDSISEFRSFYNSRKFDHVSLILADITLSDGSLEDEYTSLLACFQKVPTMIVSECEKLETLRKLLITSPIRDYLVKPFNKFELMAKVEKQLNLFKQSMFRSLNSLSNVVTFKNGFEKKLTTKQLQILATMDNNLSKKATRDEIFSSVWRGQHVGVKTLEVHISMIRKILLEADSNLEIFYESPNVYGLREVVS